MQLKSCAECGSELPVGVLASIMSRSGSRLVVNDLGK